MSIEEDFCTKCHQPFRLIYLPEKEFAFSRVLWGCRDCNIASPRYVERIDADFVHEFASILVETDVERKIIETVILLLFSIYLTGDKNPPGMITNFTVDLKKLCARIVGPALNEEEGAKFREYLNGIIEWIGKIFLPLGESEYQKADRRFKSGYKKIPTWVEGVLWSWSGSGFIRDHQTNSVSYVYVTYGIGQGIADKLALTPAPRVKSLLTKPHDFPLEPEDFGLMLERKFFPSYPSQSSS
jgi:hypothetical protein